MLVQLLPTQAIGLRSCSSPQPLSQALYHKANSLGKSRPAHSPRVVTEATSARKDPAGPIIDTKTTAMALLVSGTTVGAGILALPAVTAPAGFAASTAALAGCCLYAIVTGLLIAEVNLNLVKPGRKDRLSSGSLQQGEQTGPISFGTMTTQTLGPTGNKVVNALYIFQSYSLLVAYIARAGEIVAAAFGIPIQAAASVFAVGTACACYALPPQQLDGLNNVLVAGVVASFAALVSLVLPGVQLNDVVGVANWSQVPAALPVIALAFVYHNVVPVVVKELDGDVSKVRTSIVLGSLLPLAMFVVWELVILGSMPHLQGLADTSATAAAAAAGGATATGSSVVPFDPLQALVSSNPLAGPLVELFSFLAIVTSYIGFCLGLTDFLDDLFGLSRGRESSSSNTGNGSSNGNGTGKTEGATLGRSSRAGLGGTPKVLTYALTVLPPLGFALTNPKVFFQALDVAGTYGVMTLWGIVPAAMAWSQRSSIAALAAATPPLRLSPGRATTNGKSKGSQGAEKRVVELVPGGQPALLAVGGLALAVIVNEVILKLV